jgi:beta-lactamase class A
VYFRNLNNGPWFGLREETKFAPASLMKVTLFISYIKWIEEDLSLFSKKIILSEANSMNQLIPPEKNLIPGNDYTIGELLYAMIVYSDNAAGFTLLKNIPPERQNKTFIDLGIPPPDLTKKDYDISVKEYASFFRILYNSSYLSNNSSEKALEILAESAFRDGIVKPLPEGIKVAHKF